MTETWKPIEGASKYEVSDLGRVRSLYKSRPPRVLRQRANPRGYAIVDIYPEPWKKTTRRVHQLVMWAFVGPRPEGLHTRHLDDDKMNAALSNLKYGTPSENQHDSVRHGSNHFANRTHCGQGHKYPEGAPSRPRKGRYCSPCNTIYVRRWRQKRAAV